MNDLELTQQTNEELKANENVELLDNNNEETEEIEEIEEIIDSLIESYVDEYSNPKVLREHIYKNEKGEPIFKLVRNDTSNTDNRFTTYHYESRKVGIGTWR